MLFDLMVRDATGTYLHKVVEFKKITLDMYEDDEHLDILDEWLHEEDLNCFSSVYFFQNGREFDPPLAIEFNELDVFYKFCVNRVTYDMYLTMMNSIYPGPSKYVEDLWGAFIINPIGFIVGRREVQLFDMIIGLINESDYKG